MYVKAIIILCIIIVCFIIYLFFRGRTNRSGSGRDSTRDREIRQAISNERDSIDKLGQSSDNATEQLKDNIGVIRENNNTQRQSNSRIREIIKQAKDRNNT